MFSHGFSLDRFQVEAAGAIERGENVLVCAPTGAGKTVVAEHAVRRSLRSGLRCFYTAPIKALSNQKYNDLRSDLGDEQVGLLTGDHSIRPDAPVVVMTTEVLRNMIYAESTSLGNLGWVVLDEVHFLQDAYRGPVWEEVLMHTPPSVRFVCLSATVSNADELGEWITVLRGSTSTVVEHRRPIRLDPVMMIGDRSAEREHLVPLLVDAQTNPEGRRFDLDRPVRHGARGRRSRFYTPRRVETVERLAEERLLPSIYFIFSRNACDDAARACRTAGVRLCSPDERRAIRAVADRRTSDLGDSDLDVLGYDSWLDTIESGCAAHHAGMVPAFRETVEECFNQSLLKVVFATETLALGVNMPARSVVIERLSKFNGESHQILTPGQFTQLTGRAGRRGLDDRGTAVVLWSPFTTFDQVASLASSREFPLSSAFRPTYNMAANLVLRYDRPEAQEMLRRSFAQFQSDRSLVRMESRRLRLESELEALDAAVDTRHQVFDVGGYARAQDALRVARELGSTRADVERSLAALRPGDVVERTARRRSELLIVLAVAHRRAGTKVRATDITSTPLTLDASNTQQPVRAVAHLALPVPHLPKDPAFRRQGAAMLKRVNRSRLRSPAVQTGRADDAHDAWTALESHPLHSHPQRDQLLRSHGEHRRLEDELEKLTREMRRRGSGLVERFDAVLDVLTRTGHLDRWALTTSGERIRRIYHECDLLISLAVGEGLFDGLDASETAALASCFTYEHRSADPAPAPTVPGGPLRERITALTKLTERVHALELACGVPTTRAPELGFVAMASAWASGEELHLVLNEEVTGGDFVRNIRQVADLLRQLADVSTTTGAARAARQAAEAVVRGVVLSAAGPR